MAKEEQYHGYMDQHEDINFGKYLGLFAFLFLPGGIYALLAYYIFWKGLKWKPRVYFFVFLFLSLTLLIIGYANPPFADFDFKDTDTYIYPYVYISMWVGLLLSYFSFVYMAQQLRNYPELKIMKGWAQGHRYAKTPWQKWRHSRLIQQCKNGDFYDTETTPLGVLDQYVEYTEEGKYDRIESIDNEQVVRRYNKESVKGGIISVGASGSGKSVTMLNSIKNSIIAGRPVIVMDNKRSFDFPYFLAKWAKENNREFYHFVSGRPEEYFNKFNSKQASYDPLKSGDATSNKEMILGLREWDAASAVYKADTETILSAVFNLIEETKNDDRIHGINWEDNGIQQFIDALDIQTINSMILSFKSSLQMYGSTPTDMKKLQGMINFYERLKDVREGKRLREQLEGIVNQMRTILLSSYGYWLSSDYTDKEIVFDDIFERKDGPVVLFSFSAEKEGDAAKFMANLVLTDLRRSLSKKEAKGLKDNYAEVYIDEFQSLISESVIDTLAKSRSTGTAIYLSCQSLEQIVSSSTGDGEAVVKAFLDNAGNFIIHSGSSYSSAERFSNILGKERRIVYKKTGKRNAKLFTFQWSNSREEMVSENLEQVWKVEPIDIQKLESPTKSNGFRATAYYITKNCEDPEYSFLGGVARKLQVVVPPEITSGVPKEYEEESIRHSQEVARMKLNGRRTVSERELPTSNNQITSEEENFFITEMTSEEINRFNPNHDNYEMPKEYTNHLVERDIQLERMQIEELPVVKEAPIIQEQPKIKQEDFFSNLENNKKTLQKQNKTVKKDLLSNFDVGTTKKEKKEEKVNTSDFMSAFNNFNSDGSLKESKPKQENKPKPKGLPKL